MTAVERLIKKISPTKQIIRLLAGDFFIVSLPSPTSNS